MFSHEEDVTLANPLGPAAAGIGPFAHGWEQVARTQEHAASQFRDGEPVSVEIVEKYVTAELAYVVHIERAKAKIGGREDRAPLALRITMILRRGWHPEDCASSRRPYNHGSSSIVSPTELDLRP